MDELEKALLDAELRRAPRSLDDRLYRLLEDAVPEGWAPMPRRRRRLAYWLFPAACLAAGFIAGLFYTHWNRPTPPERVYVYPLETTYTAHPMDFTQTPTRQGSPWDTPVQVNIRSIDSSHKT